MASLSPLERQVQRAKVRNISKTTSNMTYADSEIPQTADYSAISRAKRLTKETEEWKQASEVDKERLLEDAKQKEILKRHPKAASVS